MRDEFRRFGRADQFSYGAYEYLYEYLWDLSESCDQSSGMGIEWRRKYDNKPHTMACIKFDVVAICCEWCEYDSLSSLAESYGLEDIEDDEEIADTMESRGSLIRMDGGGVLFSE
tara:strand:+ start:104 stop:448 length:345 start_codon:yes stop_codon:yes gene_type:complete